ncbi:MAG: hypothetical protein IKJ64_00035 [Bacteroidales bacterium]|nr:hypothetical protein [Bacteroidales bacterium]
MKKTKSLSISKPQRFLRFSDSQIFRFLLTSQHEKNILISLILSFIFTFNIHNEASAFNEKEGYKNMFSIDTLMKNMEIDLRLNYGFYMHHHYEMEGYRAHFPMFELSLQKQTYGKSYWQSCFNYPDVGVTLFYSGMGNIDVLGKAIYRSP